MKSAIDIEQLQRRILALESALARTDALAVELAERAEGIDSRLLSLTGSKRDCELGEVTRLKAQCAANAVLFKS